MEKKQTKKSKGGRPLKQIDEKLVYELAKIHCTQNEIAAVCCCSVDTLERRFADVIRKGDEEGKMSLKRKMHQVADRGNVTMLIWLSKQRLGYKEPKRDEEVQPVSFNVHINEVPT